MSFLQRRLRPWVAVLLLALPAPAMAEQVWSAHLFGVRVGELVINVAMGDAAYTGAASFATTGVAGALARVTFSVSADGDVTPTGPRPRRYIGRIDTGRRVSATELDFSGDVPRMISGEGGPATPIPDAALKGAYDPLTALHQVLRDRSDANLCTIDQTSFDGTRLSGLKLTERSQNGDRVTCSGLYIRLGGYPARDLDEISTSPVSITYRPVGDIWQVETIRARTRHGSAVLRRQG